MYNVIFTIDYEIHGNGDGSPFSLMVEPTYRMMKLFDKYGAKLTILADVAEILKFKEYKEEFGADKYYFNDIMKQLKYAVSNGHDVQLHIHSGYFNSTFTSTGIQQNWEEYDLANLSYELIYKRVKECKVFLETELRTVMPDYSCNVFRAANWSMYPSRNIVKALIANGIGIDTSVFKWGSRNGRVKFKYDKAPDNLLPWNVSDDDVCHVDPKGQLLEVPIYTELRKFYAFVTIIRLFRMIRARFHKHKSVEIKDKGVTSPSGKSHLKKNSKIKKILNPLLKDHAWKLDLNQASGRQLIGALKRIENRPLDVEKDIPVVFIGHSKSFIKYNEYTLGKLLAYVHKNSSKYKFSIFSELKNDSLHVVEKAKQ